MKDRETKMLGCTVAILEDSFNTAYNINMRLAGMLSDVQECIAIGEKGRANVLLNQVKYYFFEYTDTRNEVSAKKVEA